jgi:neutral ceramidase
MKNAFIRIALTALVATFALAPTSIAQAQSGKLKVGAARVDITPPINPDYPPSGKYAHEKLYIRAIVLDNGSTRAALLGADLSGLSEDIWVEASKQIAKELNCPVENIIMSATHTHSGGVAGPPPPRIPNQPRERFPGTEKAVNAMLDAVKQAKKNLQPALAGFGTGEAYLNVNRDVISRDTKRWTQAANLEGPSDKTVAVLMFKKPDGSPIAAYMNYAMHPVNGYLSGITSADFPGAASRYVEQAFGDKMVMIFSQGASGDQNPMWLRPGTNVMASKSGSKITGYELVREEIEAPLRDGHKSHGKLDPQVADTFERWMESLGIILGEETIRIMTNTRELDSEVRIWGAQDMLKCPGRKRLDTTREGSPGSYEDGDEVDIRLGLIGINDIALTTVNAEIYTIIGQRMKAQSPLSKTMMVTLANGRANSGYVINDEHYGAYTFQVLGSRLKPGCGGLGIVDGLTDLIGQHIDQ